MTDYLPLTAAEIVKYPWRWNLLRDRILAGEALQLRTGDFVVLLPPANDPQLETFLVACETRNLSYLNSLEFVSTTGKKYRLGDLAKNEDFGGKGKNTSIEALVEPNTAAYAASLYYYRIFDPQRALNDGHVIVAPNFPGLDERPDWKRTYESTARAIVDLILPNRRYKFVSDTFGHPTIKQIYDIFSRLSRTINIFGNVNKWNPSDIWVVDESTTLYDKIETINELNQILLEHLENRTIIGISLKKLANPSQPRIQFYNIEEDHKDDFDFEIFSIHTGKTFDRTKSAVLNIKHEGHEKIVRARLFGANEFSIEVENKGSLAAARGGRLSRNLWSIFGPVDYITLEEFKANPTIINSQKFRYMFTSEAEFFCNHKLSLTPCPRPEELENILNTEDYVWQISKYLSMAWVNRLMMLPAPEQALLDFVNKAMSKFAEPKSAPFVKIY